MLSLWNELKFWPFQKTCINSLLTPRHSPSPNTWSVFPSPQELNLFSCVGLFVTPWTVACCAPLSMGFSRQAYWSGLPFPSPGHLPNPGMEPTSLGSSALIGSLFTTSASWEAPFAPIFIYYMAITGFLYLKTVLDLQILEIHSVLFATQGDWPFNRWGNWSSEMFSFGGTISRFCVHNNFPDH